MQKTSHLQSGCSSPRRACSRTPAWCFCTPHPRGCAASGAGLHPSCSQSRAGDVCCAVHKHDFVLKTCLKMVSIVSSTFRLFHPLKVCTSKRSNWMLFNQTKQPQSESLPVSEVVSQSVSQQLPISQSFNDSQSACQWGSQSVNDSQSVIRKAVNWTARQSDSHVITPSEAACEWTTGSKTVSPLMIPSQTVCEWTLDNEAVWQSFYDPQLVSPTVI